MTRMPAERPGTARSRRVLASRPRLGHPTTRSGPDVRDEHVARLVDVLPHDELRPLGVAALERLRELEVVVGGVRRCSGEYQMYDL